MRAIRPECNNLFDDLRKDLYQIKNNHLTHIQSSVLVIETRMFHFERFMYGIAGLLGAILVALVVAIL